MYRSPSPTAHVASSTAHALHRSPMRPHCTGSPCAAPPHCQDCSITIIIVCDFVATLFFSNAVFTEPPFGSVGVIVAAIFASITACALTNIIVLIVVLIKHRSSKRRLYATANPSPLYEEVSMVKADNTLKERSQIDSDHFYDKISVDSTDMQLNGSHYCEMDSDHAYDRISELYCEIAAGPEGEGHYEQVPTPNISYILRHIAMAKIHDEQVKLFDVSRKWDGFELYEQISGYEQISSYERVCYNTAIEGMFTEEQNHCNPAIEMMFGSELYEQISGYERVNYNPSIEEMFGTTTNQPYEQISGYERVNYDSSIEEMFAITTNQPYEQISGYERVHYDSSIEEVFSTTTSQHYERISGCEEMFANNSLWCVSNIAVEARQ